jgi:hypothetical protein
MIKPPQKEALLPTPVGARRFLTRTTHERWGWCAPSRGLIAHLVKRLQYNGRARKNESVNIVYVASLLHIDGIGHVGRSLARHLSTEHGLQVCGAIVRQDSDLLQSRVRDWVMSAEALDEIDVVYMEGGWNDDGKDRTIPA